MSFDTTVGGADANSYASVAEFNAYAATRLPAVTWFGTADDPTKENALMCAARVLDACFDWTGTAVDLTTPQALCWPRSGMLGRIGNTIPTTVNPTELKNAQCELALQIGNGDLFSDNAAKKAGVSSVTAGPVSVSFQSQVTSTSESVDIMVRRMQSEFLYVSDSIPQAVRMLLVPSWFNQPSILRDFLIDSAN